MQAPPLSILVEYAFFCWSFSFFFPRSMFLLMLFTASWTWQIKTRAIADIGTRKKRVPLLTKWKRPFSISRTSSSRLFLTERNVANFEDRKWSREKYGGTGHGPDSLPPKPHELYRNKVRTRLVYVKEKENKNITSFSVSNPCRVIRARGGVHHAAIGTSIKRNKCDDKKRHGSRL